MKRTPAGLALLLLIVAPLVVFSQTAEKAEQILQQQFPGARVERKTLYLTRDAQASLAAELGEEVSRVQTFYLAHSAAGLVGFGTFDTHIVRTKQETLFIVMDAAGIIKHVEVAAFLEPRDYLAPARWLALFRGRTYGDAMDVPGITGATLTVKSVKNSVKRTLALARIHRTALK